MLNKKTLTCLNDLLTDANSAFFPVLNSNPYLTNTSGMVKLALKSSKDTSSSTCSRFKLY